MPKLTIDIEARLAAFQDSLDEVRRSTEQMATGLQAKFAGITTAIAGLGAALAGAKFTMLITDAIDAADQLNKLSQKVGVTVEALSELQYAGKLADVGTEALGTGLKKLAVNLQEGAAGSKEAQAVFQAVGISVQELGKLSPDQALGRIAEAFSKAADGAGKTALAVKLFGKSGADLIPLLNQGAGGLRAAADEARRFGLVVSADTARAAEEFNDNLTRLKSAATGFGTTLANEVLPMLGQTAKAMADAAKSGGVLWGVIRGISELGKIALQGGADPSELKAQRDYILSIRGEIAKLQDSVAGKGALGNGLLDRLFYGDGADKRRKLAELQITLRDAERAFKNMQNRPAPEGPQAQIGLQGATGGGGGGGAPRDGTQRIAALGAQMVLDQLNDLEKQARRIMAEAEQARKETEAEIERGIQLGPMEAERQMLAAQQRLQSLMGQTKGGQRQAVYDDLKFLNEAFDTGKISADQLGESYVVLRERLEQIDKGVKDTTPGFQIFADDAISQMREIENAIRRVGSTVTEELVAAFQKGRLDVSKIISAILTDLARLQIQRAITTPLFNALGGLFGAGVGAKASTPTPAGTPFANPLPGKAIGGPVAASAAYLVGERGPEIFIPNGAGRIVPNAGGGGSTIVLNINTPTDGAVIRAAVLQGAALAQSQIARAGRIGAMS